MIVDVLSQVKLYEGVHPTLVGAVKATEKLIADGAPNGRHELMDGAYVMLQSYDTTPAETFTFEAHRAYIDVQVMIKGDEICLVTERAATVVTEPYKADGDYELLATEKVEGVHTVSLTDGVFAVFFPEDAHAPGLAVDEAAPVYKAVIKLPVLK